MATRNFVACVTDDAWKELGPLAAHLETAPGIPGQSGNLLVCSAVDFSGLFVKLDVVPRQGAKAVAVWLPTSRVRYVVDFRVVKALIAASASPATQ